MSRPAQSAGGNGEGAVVAAGLGATHNVQLPFLPRGAMSHAANLPSSPRAKAQRDTRKCRQSVLLSSTTVASGAATAAGGSAASAARAKIVPTWPRAGVHRFIGCPF